MRSRTVTTVTYFSSFLLIAFFSNYFFNLSGEAFLRLFEQEKKQKTSRNISTSYQENILQDDAVFFPPVVFGDGGQIKVNMLDLRNKPGFAQTDYMVACGAPDTLALLLYTNAENYIEDLHLTVRLPSGLEYGGFVLGGRPGSMIEELNVSDPETPVFNIPSINQDSFRVVYIGVRANCNNSPMVSRYFNTYEASYKIGRAHV